MEAFKYRIITEWSDVDQVFVARVPALGPGCAAHGNSPERAAKEVQIAAGLMLDILREDGDALPEPDASCDFSGKLGLRLPKSMHEQVARLAAADDVSINTKLLTLIAYGLGQRAEHDRERPPRRRTVRYRIKAQIPVQGLPKPPASPTSDRPRKMDSFIEELGGGKPK